ncbi:hypothetical protein N658DRAFT_501728 [Parathielavia hyrcaniae]|uniref:Uncharacterized protein n=1 Tax=Parathielavia hyrcaniae TaxID=113614 RepID=A0AAN6SXB7_9PEZI|nr:hypothetical protein N658DRAFT_501728 [Parathielavia hyrcaniae]
MALPSQVSNLLLGSTSRWQPRSGKCHPPLERLVLARRHAVSRDLGQDDRVVFFRVGVHFQATWTPRVRCTALCPLDGLLEINLAAGRVSAVIVGDSQLRKPRRHPRRLPVQTADGARLAGQNHAGRCHGAADAVPRRGLLLLEPPKEAAAAAMVPVPVPLNPPHPPLLVVLEVLKVLIPRPPGRVGRAHALEMFGVSLLGLAVAEVADEPADRPGDGGEAPSEGYDERVGHLANGSAQG